MGSNERKYCGDGLGTKINLHRRSWWVSLVEVESNIKMDDDDKQLREGDDEGELDVSGDAGNVVSDGENCDNSIFDLSNDASLVFPESDADSTIIKMLNTNARSLSPKIHSLLDNFRELELDLAVVTESWLADSRELDGDLVDLEEGTDLKVCLFYTSDAADE